MFIKECALTSHKALFMIDQKENKNLEKKASIHQLLIELTDCDMFVNWNIT